eukprot:1190425-Rhodomonas_salina.1
MLLCRVAELVSLCVLVLDECFMLVFMVLVYHHRRSNLTSLRPESSSSAQLYVSWRPESSSSAQ